MSTQTNTETPKELQIRILDNSYVTERGCWEWIRSISSRGYGQICYGNKSHLAHRVSHKSFKGDPQGMLVCHRCDNPKCVNPDHLFLGSDADNLNDCYSKGRRKIRVAPERRAELVMMSANGKSYSEIAKAFGCSNATVGLIVRAQKEAKP